MGKERRHGGPPVSELVVVCLSVREQSKVRVMHEALVLPQTMKLLVPRKSCLAVCSRRIASRAGLIITRP